MSYQLLFSPRILKRIHGFITVLCLLLTQLTMFSVNIAQAAGDITDLTVSGCVSNACMLNWTANHNGNNSSYDIRYSLSAIASEADWNNALPVKGQIVPAANGETETFAASGLDVSTTYYFAIKTTDSAGESGLSNSPGGTTATDANTGGLLVDHNAVMEFDQIPDYWIEQAKNLTFHYAHRSHGSRIVTGVEYLEEYHPDVATEPYKYNYAKRVGTTEGLPPAENPAALRMWDGAIGDTYALPPTYWDSSTGVTGITNAANTNNYNYSMWIWCDELTYYSQWRVDNYLSAIDAFNDLPDSNTRFIYTTSRSGRTAGERELVNGYGNQIRKHAIDNGMIVYDFQDLERYDPDGNYFPDTDDDGFSPDTSNWQNDYCSNNPDYCSGIDNISYCSHSPQGGGAYGLICLTNGKAFWWMMARLAGWDGSTTGGVLSITTTSLPNAVQYSDYNFNLSAIGGSGSYAWSVTDGSLPGGITLSSAGLLSGTPDQEGTYSFTVQVDDGSDTLSQALDLVVEANVLEITTTSLSDAYLNSFYNQTVEAIRGSVASYSWSITNGSLPDGLSLDSDTGEISGTPSAEGIFSFTVTVNDGTQTDSEPLNIMVNPEISEIIVDNQDGSPGFTTSGSWIESDGGSEYDGSSFDGNSDTAVWTPDLPIDAEYEVYTWWSQGNNRPTNAHYYVNFANSGTATVYVDQSQNSGQWNLLGTYNFNAGMSGNVVLEANNASYDFNADAVRFILKTDTTAPMIPTDLQATALSDARVDLTWDALPESDLAGFSLYRDGSFLAEVSGTSYSDTSGLTASTTYDYTISAFDTNGNESAQSDIESVTTLVEAPREIEVRVQQSSDDAEEYIGTSQNVSLTSSDLELADEAATQAIGIRFQGLNIPLGATITNAYLEFTAYGNGSDQTSLVIRAEQTDNALQFTADPYNVSSRITNSSVSVAWSNIPAWTLYQTYQSPDLSSVVQEIVDRDNWARNNAMTFIITGSGTRTAYSFDGSQGQSPLLHVEFSDGQQPPAPTNLRIR